LVWDWFQRQSLWLLFYLGICRGWKLAETPSSPSRHHESSKTRIGDLLLIYFLETNTKYFPMGSTTLRQAPQPGGEPDESYCIGSDKDVPELAIEVVITSGSINRLALYQRLCIREVWFWQDDAFTPYHQHSGGVEQCPETFGYEVVTRSRLLPDLDIALLAACVRNPSPLAAAKAFRQQLQTDTYGKS